MNIIFLIFFLLSLSHFYIDARRYHSNLEILFMQRVSRDSDRWSGHISFPGGKQDLPQDLTDFDTATRECLEEIGLDLKSSENFYYLGELDDRLVKSRFGNQDLLILSPQVFIQVAKTAPSFKIAVTEVVNASWVPLSHILKFVNKPSAKKGLNKLSGSIVKLWHSVDIADYLLVSKISGASFLDKWTRSSLRFFFRKNAF